MADFNKDIEVDGKLTANEFVGLNKSGGVFNGVFDVSKNVNTFYNDYLSGNVVNFSLSATKILGSFCTVRILGGLVGTISEEILNGMTGEEISVSPSKINEITLLYVGFGDVRAVVRTFDIPQAPDTESPTKPVLTESNVGSNSFDLSWVSTDNIGIVGSRVYLGGVLNQTINTSTLNTTITGLTPETAYNVTVETFDLAGNVSELSSVLAVSTIPLAGGTINYTFDGTTLDSDFTIINPDSANIQLGQNDNLYGEVLQSVSTTNRDNRVQHVRQFSLGTFEFDYNSDVFQSSGVVLYSLDDGDFAGFIKDTANNYIRIHSSDSGSTYTSEVLNNQRMRIVWDGTDAVCSYYNGSAWVVIGTLSAPLTNVRLIVYGNPGASSAINDKVEMDNLTISNYIEL